MSRKARRSYITWNGKSECSSESSSSERDEEANLCLMTHHHKKKNVSHSKYKLCDGES